MAINTKQFKYIIFKSNEVEREVTIINGLPFYKSSATASNVIAWLPFYGFYPITGCGAFNGRLIKPGMLRGIGYYTIPKELRHAILQTGMSNDRDRVTREYQIIYSIKLGYTSPGRRREADKLARLAEEQHKNFFEKNSFEIKFIKDTEFGDNGVITTETEVIEWLDRHKLILTKSKSNPLQYRAESYNKEFLSALLDLELIGPELKPELITTLGVNSKRVGPDHSLDEKIPLKKLRNF